jgi:hypothetical protein
MTKNMLEKILPSTTVQYSETQPRRDWRQTRAARSNFLAVNKALAPF